MKNFLVLDAGFIIIEVVLDCATQNEKAKDVGKGHAENHEVRKVEDVPCGDYRT